MPRTTDNDGNYAISSDPWKPTQNDYVIMGSFIAMGLLSSLEVLVLTLSRFRQKRGLYFWSVVVATLGGTVWIMGLLTFYFLIGRAKLWVSTLLLNVGYLTYTPTEFLVLYSRLSLVNPGQRIMIFFKLLCIGHVIFVMIPTAVFATGAFTSFNPLWLRIDGVFARIEVSIYAAVQIIIALLYISCVMRMLDKKTSVGARRTLYHLIYANVCIILIHAGSITMECVGKVPLRVCWSGFQGAFQLKIEFWALSQLTDMVRPRSRDFGETGTGAMKEAEEY
ncbi:hypothetical protein BT63DRAFT_460937 [Microthyrium microscopicum]|uniref:DUF7703 domain-containing protein n=1 Tax=Microthyrium microscopicum TaxID=703497 RepID=A0A6A6TUS0_9PEZI|nr:hypothetical protein BT63DRAFT_460937 [Microthyrium microscopicum]